MKFTTLGDFEISETKHGFEIYYQKSFVGVSATFMGCFKEAAEFIHKQKKGVYAA